MKVFDNSILPVYELDSSTEILFGTLLHENFSPIPFKALPYSVRLLVPNSTLPFSKLFVKERYEYSRLLKFVRDSRNSLKEFGHTYKLSEEEYFVVLPAAVNYAKLTHLKLNKNYNLADKGLEVLNTFASVYASGYLGAITFIGKDLDSV